MTDDLVQKLTDHAALIRKMDAIANEGRTTQTHEATAALLDKAARVITLYRARSVAGPQQHVNAIDHQLEIDTVRQID
jgi:aryl-alcohol dehydrogenase-like predicted oxidoreductase